MRALYFADHTALWTPTGVHRAPLPPLPQRRRRLRAAAAAAGESDGSSAAASADDPSSSYVWPTSPSWLKGPKSAYRGAVSGGSGGASFGLGGSAGAGKAGLAAFVGSPWQGPATAPPVHLGVAGAAAAAAAPAAAAGTVAAAAAGQGGFWNLASLQQRLQSLGLAGVMAYGLCNTLYYTATFAFVWLAVAKVPRGLGLAASAQKFVAVMATVWAGSQVTKVPRAAAALVLAPVVDRLMAWLQRVTKLESRRQVFGWFVACCLGLALTLFSVVVLAWATNRTFNALQRPGARAAVFAGGAAAFARRERRYEKQLCAAQPASPLLRVSAAACGAPCAWAVVVAQKLATERIQGDQDAMRGEALPPLGAARSPLGGKLSRGGSRDCGGSAAAAATPLLQQEGSDATLTVSRSALSGSSKAPFPPDRSFVNDFDWTKKSRDLPAHVRPIIEDNKMLHEELRRYRQRLGEQEGTIATQDRTIAALRDELQRQRAQVRECSGVSPAQLLQEQQFRKEIKERDETIRELQQKVDVLLRAKAAVERRLTNDLAAERRAAAALRQQMKTMQEEMAEKAKQHRFNQLHIKDLYQRLEPLEAAVAAAAQQAQQALPPPAPAPPPEPEVVCKVMLCMVYEQPQPTAAEIAEAAAQLVAQEAAQQAAEQRRRVAAATRLQAAARGFLARRRLEVQHAAATTIQAAARGFLVRQALATIWEADEAAEEAAQSAAAMANLSPAQHLALRQREAELHYQRRAAAGKAKPQKRLPGRPGSTTRGANTAVEAAARRRSLMPAGTEGARSGASTAARRASSVALLASSGGSGSGGSGSGSGLPRRLSSLAGPGSRSLGPAGLQVGAGAGGAGRDEAGRRPGNMGGRPSWTGAAAGPGAAARATSSASEGSAAGSPSGSPVPRHGRPSMSRVPRLDLAQQDAGTRQRSDQQQLGQAGGQRQAGGQQRDSQRQPRSPRSEEGAQQECAGGGSPSWQLELGRPPPSEFLVLPTGSQPRKRRESLGFGSSKTRA